MIPAVTDPAPILARRNKLIAALLIALTLACYWPVGRFAFINYDDNSRLDADGFAPFGQVVTGMEVVDKFYAPPDDAQPDQRRILREGNEYLGEKFPQLDFVKKATIIPATPVKPATPAKPAAPGRRGRS